MYYTGQSQPCNSAHSLGKFTSESTSTKEILRHCGKRDRKRGNISRDDARKAKAHVCDLLYDALRTADFSVEELERKLESDNLYPACGVRRLKKPRGRPKVKDGDGA